MATKKITDLTELTTPADGDLLLITDISEALDINKSKKIQHINLLSAVNTAIGVLQGEVDALQAPPKVRVNVTTDFSSTTSLANIAWENEDYDTDTMWNSAVNANRIYFTTAGLYLITLSVVWSSGTAGSYRHAGIYLTGSTAIGGLTIPAASGAIMPATVSLLYQFTAGQYITAKVQSGESENITDAAITAVRLSD